MFYNSTGNKGYLRQVLLKPGAGIELRPWTEITMLLIKLIRNLNIVANAADFTRQYKMRLGKVADIAFWKGV